MFPKIFIPKLKNNQFKKIEIENGITYSKLYKFEEDVSNKTKEEIEKLINSKKYKILVSEEYG